MNYNEVFEVIYPISQYGNTLSPGDFVEVLRMNNGPSPNDVQVARYRDMRVVYVDRYALEGNARLVSTTSITKSHPLYAKVYGLAAASQGLSSGAAIDNAMIADAGRYMTPRKGYGLQGLDLGPPIYDEATHTPKCECGCASVGISNHSDYCPLYSKENT